MNSILVLVVGIGILIAGYVFYGNGLPGSGALIRNGKPLHSPRRTVWTTFLPKLLS